jgi:sulfur carrier protein
MPRGGRCGLCSDQAFPVIALRVNGKEVELDGPTRLVAYLEQLGVSPRAVAVEHNGNIIDRDDYAATLLADGDVVEIVRMVGGGRPGLSG